MNAIKITNATARSTTLAKTVASGMIKRGKYIFVIRLAFPTKQLPATAIAPEKKVHSINPEYANNGYGIPFEEIRTNRPKTTVNTSVMRSGCKSTQAIPKAVCLYLTFRSRQTRK